MDEQVTYQLFSEQRAGILLFLYIYQIFMSGFGMRIFEVIKSKYRKKLFPQNSVWMAKFPGERRPDK